ncbi:O-antigen ligase family protein [Mycobacterium sp. IDR2000157661]|uniref:O-antigen ligase family protein n=1 Tax=Mycobacterium sp. IDR2000157661 TaxID=2867005 RepID=UPI001EEADF55|nr:O-antigen ligase family protein [Mycobacterium sp. IDR2000157661]ULE32416.1 O-antigen ligase family protein [Mycobacterium sp. IDR2000157661]
MSAGPASRLGSFSAATALLLGCFTVGVFAVRSTTEGLLLIGVLGCLVVYLTGAHRMVWLALFAAFASLPESWHVAKVVGPVSVYAHQVAVLVAIGFLIPRARLRFTHCLPPMTMLLAIAVSTAMGMLAGHDGERVAREASFLVEMVAGAALAILIVRADQVRQAIRAVAVVMWFSAAMILAASVTGLRLAGRAESLQAETGAGAIRLLTATQAPALTVLTALVAAQILGRARLSHWALLGVPALIVTLLSFSRHTLIALAVAAMVALLASIGWAALRRSALLAVTGVAALALAVPTSLFLLQDGSGGGWLADQVGAFTHRVVGGVSTSALAVDSSTLARLHENDSLWRAIGDAPVLGHGLGYAYQLPFGEAGSFTATLGTTYAHNFYLWWLVKAGVLGMVAFAVFALLPVARALRSEAATAKISAAVCLGLLAICIVDPLPLEPSSSLTLGMALGSAFAFSRRSCDVGSPMSPPATPTALPAAHTSR